GRPTKRIRDRDDPRWNRDALRGHDGVGADPRSAVGPAMAAAPRGRACERRASPAARRSVLIGDGAAAGLRRVPLLVRAVARAHERAAEHRTEAECLALLAEPAELVRMDPTVDR